MSFDLGTGITAINTILAEEANRIGQDIHKRTLHQSPWVDLTKQTAFPDGMGYQLTTLIYDRAVATTDTAGNTQGAGWSAVGTLSTGGNQFNTSLNGADAQPLDDTADDFQGGRGTGSSDNRAYAQFSKQLKEYSLSRAVIESPRISMEDLRHAAHRQEQLRAIMDTLSEVTHNVWENRYRDEYERVCANFVPVLTSGTPILTTVDADTDATADDTFEGVNITSIDPVTSGSGNTDVTPAGFLSNAIMDKIYYNLIRKAGHKGAYGVENGRPVFSVIMSSEASRKLMIESEFRDDVRYNNAKVGDLIAPLGVEKSFRGFYHLVDDLAPRFSITGSTITKVEPYSVANGVATPNADYDTASYEAAYILHPDVCESQIPQPFSGANGVKFDPLSYKGDFRWTNILNEVTNPDGTIGFFRGVLASATKPIRTDLGYVVLFKRDSGTAGA